MNSVVENSAPEDAALKQALFLFASNTVFTYPNDVFSDDSGPNIIPLRGNTYRASGKKLLLSNGLSH